MLDKTKICTQEGTAVSCVIIRDGLDELTRLSDAQKKSFSTAFKTFIKNASADGKKLDISKYGTGVTSADFRTSKQIKSDIALLNATTQFVGYNVITRKKSRQNWNSVTIYSTFTGGRAKPYTQPIPASTGGEMQCGWYRDRNPQNVCSMYINMDWGDHRTNPSGLARTIIHEFLHHEKEMGAIVSVNQKHRKLDQRARAMLREWGLADGGCKPVNESFLFGPSYPGCDPQNAR